MPTTHFKRRVKTTAEKVNVSKSPQALIKYLKTNPPKAQQQFRDGAGRCCLGHYADMCGLVYAPEQGAFVKKAEMRERLAVGLTSDLWEITLPDSHWMFRQTPSEYREYGSFLQDTLAFLNDDDSDYERIIHCLELVVAEMRDERRAA